MSERERVTVEATGETVGEAKWAALRELESRVPGLDREQRGVPGRLGGRARAARRRLHARAGGRERASRRSRRRRASTWTVLRPQAPQEIVERIAAGIGGRRLDLRSRARRCRDGELLRRRRRALHRQARPDDRRDPVPRERDHARPGRRARGGRRRGGISGAANGDARGARSPNRPACRGDGPPRPSSSR